MAPSAVCFPMPLGERHPPEIGALSANQGFRAERGTAPIATCRDPSARFSNGG
jgi:hypothetical protein